MDNCFTCSLPCKKKITGCLEWRPVASLNKFDPVPELEAAGISNFDVDYDRHRVKVSGPDFAKLKKAIGDKVFYYRGMDFSRGTKGGYGGVTIYDELKQAQGQLDQAWQNFDYAAAEYIDVAIAELQAAEAKVNLLFRLLKKAAA